MQFILQNSPEETFSAVPLQGATVATCNSVLNVGSRSDKERVVCGNWCRFHADFIHQGGVLWPCLTSRHWGGPTLFLEEVELDAQVNNVSDKHVEKGWLLEDHKVLGSKWTSAFLVTRFQSWPLSSINYILHVLRNNPTSWRFIMFNDWKCTTLYENPVLSVISHFI